jgi:hypothetical protein
MGHDRMVGRSVLGTARRRYPFGVSSGFLGLRAGLALAPKGFYSHDALG